MKITKGVKNNGVVFEFEDIEYSLIPHDDGEGSQWEILSADDNDLFEIDRFPSLFDALKWIQEKQEVKK